MPSRLLVTALSSIVLPLAAIAADPPSFAAWKEKASIRPVLSDAKRHSMHTYYVTSPESPDGKSVLLFTSTDPAGHKGNVVIFDRATGNQTVLAKDVVTEDAHRIACQQWLSNGKRVVYHALRGDEWIVAVIDVATGAERILAKGRQVGMAASGGDIVPVTGLHWEPNGFADLELIDVVSGKRIALVTAVEVRKAYPELVAELFQDLPIAIYFPILSPDGRRVIFKLSHGKGGDFRSKGASKREGLVCYDLRDKKFLWMQKRWGHPAWSADGTRVINMGLIETDAATGKTKRYDKFPPFPGSHPSYAPEGKLFTTDALVTPTSKGVWSVVVGEFDSRMSVVIHRFDNTRGAKSWRRSHPHPAFSPDGRRLYFNVSDGEWTRLYVAECGR